MDFTLSGPALHQLGGTGKAAFFQWAKNIKGSVKSASQGGFSDGAAP
jgi:hypothetical protein